MMNQSGNPLINNIVDELCSCGHFKSQHNPTSVDAKDGGYMRTITSHHGDCMMCNCAKFTWKAFIFTWNVTLERDVTVNAESQKKAEDLAKARFGGYVTGSWKA